MRGDPVAKAAIPPAPTAIAARPVRITLAAFSAVREALGTKIVPQFQRQQERGGQPFDLAQTYAGSELLTKALAGGFAADIAVLAHTHDLDTLVRSGLVAPDWHAGPHRGIVCRSLVVLAVRKGNPKAIHDWRDLVRPDVRIVTPDPATSGGGMWNLCAAYGAALRGHAGVAANDPAAARDFLARVRANVVDWRNSSSESYRAFRDGTGDVAITYESEVAFASLFGHDEDRVIPTSTVLVESPAARIDHPDRAPGVRDAAQAFLSFLWTPEAQKHFAFCGLRPVHPEIAAARRAQFPEPKDLWTIDFLGGWASAQRTVLATPTTPARPAPGK